MIVRLRLTATEQGASSSDDEIMAKIEAYLNQHRERFSVASFVSRVLIFEKSPIAYQMGVVSAISKDEESGMILLATIHISSSDESWIKKIVDDIGEIMVNNWFVIRSNVGRAETGRLLRYYSRWRLGNVVPQRPRRESVRRQRIGGKGTTPARK